MFLSDVVVQGSQSSVDTQASQGATGQSTSGPLSSSPRPRARQKKAIGKGLPITSYFSKQVFPPSLELPSDVEDEEIVKAARDSPHICSVVHTPQLLPRPAAQMATITGRWFPIFQKPTRLPTGVASGFTPVGLSPGVPSSAESPCLDLPRTEPPGL